MDRLDEELALAAEAEDDPPPVQRPAAEAGQVAHEPAPDRGQRLRRIGLVAILVVTAVSALVLVLQSLETAAVYSKGVDELVSDRDRLTTRTVLVDGTLVSGTLRRRDQPCEYRFAIAKHGVTLEVRYPHCIVPDTFRDLPGSRVDVTVEGQLTAEGFLSADRILAKCPSRYEMDQRAKGGVERPHAAPAAGAARSD